MMCTQLAAAAFNKVTAQSAWSAMNPGWNVCKSALAHLQVLMLTMASSWVTLSMDFLMRPAGEISVVWLLDPPPPPAQNWDSMLMTKQVSEKLLDTIKADGIKSIRIPVTWADHFETQAPDCSSHPPTIPRTTTY